MRIMKFLFVVAMALVAIVLAPVNALAQTSGAQATGSDPPVLDPDALSGLLSQHPVLAYIGIIGVAIPFALALITKQRWARDTKLMIWFGVCVALGAGYWAVDHWQNTEAVMTIIAILAISGFLYRMNNNAFDDLQAKRGLT